MMRWLFLTAFLLIPSTATGQAFVESVFPPSVQRGKTTRVVVRGQKLLATTHLWTTFPVGQVKCVQFGKSKSDVAVFDITVPAKAPLGMYGLRVATRDGLSNAHVFAVDDMTHVVEQEAMDLKKSNYKLKDAQQIQLPAAIAATCDRTDIDHFSFDVKAGQTLSFEVVGNRFGKAFDPVVTILDPQGAFVTNRDNDIGLFFDCRFSHTFKKAGRYRIRIHDSRFQGDRHWAYLLRIGRFPVARVAVPSSVDPAKRPEIRFPQLASVRRRVSNPLFAGHNRFFFDFRRPGDNGSAWVPMVISRLPNQLEKEPNDNREQASAVKVPANLHGVIGKENDSDFFAFDLKKGQKLVFRSDTRDMGSAADLELVLTDSKGKELRRADDTGFEDAKMEFSVPANGRYRLEVIEVVRKGGPTYAYRIEVSERHPRLELDSEVGRIAVPQNTYQPFPLKLRKIDFSGPVKLELIGAPKGMTLTHTKAEKDGQTINARLAIASSVPTGIYTLQVRASATPKNSKTPLVAIAKTSPLLDRMPDGQGPHGEPFELREDQRRLPHSLADRIAVVVTPPSSYDFSVVEKLVIVPRYLSTEFHVETVRRGLKGDIKFVARGGQLNQNRLRKPTIRPSLEIGTAKKKTVTGTLRSYVNTTLSPQRVTLTGTAITKSGRVINLTRIFALDVKISYRPATAVKKIELLPGESKKVRLLANRRDPFLGPLTISLSDLSAKGIVTPKQVKLIDAQPDAEITITVKKTAKPGKYNLGFSGTTRVNGLAESGGGDPLEIIVLQPKNKKK